MIKNNITKLNMDATMRQKKYSGLLCEKGNEKIIAVPINATKCSGTCLHQKLAMIFFLVAARLQWVYFDEWLLCAITKRSWMVSSLNGLLKVMKSVMWESEIFIGRLSLKLLQFTVQVLEMDYVCKILC